MVSPPEPCPPQAGLWCGCHVRRPNVRLFWFGTARTEMGSTLDTARICQLKCHGKPIITPLTERCPCEAIITPLTERCPCEPIITPLTERCPCERFRSL